MENPPAAECADPIACLPWEGGPLRRPAFAWHYLAAALALLALAYHGAGEHGWFGAPCRTLLCPCHWGGSYHHFIPLLSAISGAAILVYTFAAWRAERHYSITPEGIEVEEHLPLIGSTCETRPFRELYHARLTPRAGGLADLRCRYVDLTRGKGASRERHLTLRNIPAPVAQAAAARCKPY